MLGLLAVGCVGAPRSTLEEARQAQDSVQALSVRLESLEDRLLANQANVHLWQELGRRRERVTEVACGTQQAHYTAMVEHLQRQEDKGRLLRRRRNAEGEGPLVARAKGMKR